MYRVVDFDNIDFVYDVSFTSFLFIKLLTRQLSLYNVLCGCFWKGWFFFILEVWVLSRNLYINIPGLESNFLDFNFPKMEVCWFISWFMYKYNYIYYLLIIILLNNNIIPWILYDIIYEIMLHVINMIVVTIFPFILEPYKISFMFQNKQNVLDTRIFHVFTAIILLFNT